MVTVRVDKLTFSDGTEVDTPRNGLVVFVGPNNVGKSQALREIYNSQRSYDYEGVVLRSVETYRNLDGIEGWVEANLHATLKDNSRGYLIDNVHYPFDVLLYQLDSERSVVLQQLFFSLLNASARLDAANKQQNIDFPDESPKHPIHGAVLDSSIENLIDAESRKAFGMGAVLDRFGGAGVGFRVGEAPEVKLDGRKISSSYFESMWKLPRLDDQGDGVRSYLGMLLYLETSRDKVLLIDEPEAFLHPPQARLLGQVLAERSADHQVFVATHDSDILKGVLAARAPKTIVRITREGSVNHASIIDQNSVKALESDPFLRSSNLFDGLFHDGVVLCEGDSDCRFYSAALDAFDNNDETIVDRRRPDLLFVSCDGTSKMSSIVETLRRARVPFAVICDFDFLQDFTRIEKLMAAVGGMCEEY